MRKTYNETNTLSETSCQEYYIYAYCIQNKSTVYILNMTEKNANISNMDDLLSTRQLEKVVSLVVSRQVRHICAPNQVTCLSKQLVPSVLWWDIPPLPSSSNTNQVEFCWERT